MQAFARVELPVWSSYALGAGRGTRAAAANLSKDGVTWFTNFFQNDNLSYLEGGGNGAAMRIQPHVWAAPAEAKPRELMLAIVRNAISTHGHARAIVGAVLHALCVQFALLSGTCPSITDLRQMLIEMEGLTDVLSSDGDISLVWIPTWEDRSGKKFGNAIAETLQEVAGDMDRIATTSGGPDEKYRAAVEKIGGLENSQKGSGTKTAILAAFLAHEFSTSDHEPALVAAANVIQSDTDSIASMAGAILGAASGSIPEGDLMDRAYIETEAKRLAEVGARRKADQFSYPDLFKWSPPKSQLDAVLSERSQLYVSGLGPVAEEGNAFHSGVRSDELWQFLKMKFGQTLLIKRRRAPTHATGPGSTPKKTMPTDNITDRNSSREQLSLSGVEVQRRPRSIDELTSEAIAKSFDPLVIGEHLLELSEGANGIEKATAYAAIIAKARISRQKRKRYTGQNRTEKHA